MRYLRSLVKTVFVATVVMIFVGVGQASAATLIGDTVTVQYLFPDTGTPAGCCGFPVDITGAVGTAERVVDSFPGGPYFGVDLETDSIKVDFIQATVFTPPSATFDGLWISNIDNLIIGVIVAGIDASRVTFGSNEIFINFQNLFFTRGATVTVSLQSAVPLPAALPLLMGGLGLMGWMARRTRRNAMAEGAAA
jgi:hypothetical protein